jgi:hypothetical protein
VVRERGLWIVVATAIAVLGVLGLTQASGYEAEGFFIPFKLINSLVAAFVCGAALLSGLALVRRERLLPIAAAFLLSTPITYTLLLVGIWDESFAEHHLKLLESVSVIALALALLGPLFALTRARDPATLVLMSITVVLICVSAIFGLVLIGRQRASDAAVADLEIITTLAVTGFFLTPVIKRAIEAGKIPGSTPAQGA